MKSTVPRLPIDAPPAADWRPPSPQEIYRHPLPLLGPMDRVLTRAVNTLLLPRFTSVTGLEHVGREADPFILALNHSTRFEAVALPALLMYVRGGALVHFMADWNFQMIPGIGLLYRRSGAIVVMRKSARPRFLNALKPIYAPAGPSHERALVQLKAGRSIGIFPEGTVNHDPERLLRGRPGAARLSLEAGVPVVPGGIRITGGTPRRPLISLEIGAPLAPRPTHGRQVSNAIVREWHAAIMTEIARLCGKTSEPIRQERRNETP
jgi:1-acyl-sn-glycerol-3-phosphate acyltransferase